MHCKGFYCIYKTSLFALLVSLFISLFNNTADAVSFQVGNLRLEKPIKTLREIKGNQVVRQSLDYSCGAAGLSTIMNYHLGEPISEQEIINGILKTVDLAKVKERKGFSLLDLKNFIESKGYKATGYKMDITFLKELRQPVLVPIKFKNYRHFVIVKGIIGDRVFIADPAVGNMTMKSNRFENIWAGGIGLVVERNAKEEGPTDADISTLVKKEEAVFADYQNILRLVQQNALRTAVFPDEF